MKRSSFAVVFVFAAIVGTTAWYVSRLQDELLKTVALSDAAHYSSALEQFRTLYTSEVVATAIEHGLTVTHDYKDQSAAIPLPATLSMLLGKSLGDGGKGGSSRLYSPYPFPWRKHEGGLRDEFDRKAWESFQNRPNEPYYRFEVGEHGSTLRYATADLMRRACVDCHNSHPDTPRTDWRVGDVRGVLEVTLPLAAVEEHTESGMRRMITLLLFLGGAGAAAVLMIVRMRTASHQRLEEAHEDLKRTQEQLVHAGRLAGLGELGAGIAHELNQPLAAIKTLSELMLVEPEVDHADDHRLILRQTERMSKIVDNIRSFARQTPLELVSIDPAHPLRAALELLEEQLRINGVNLILDVPDEIPTVLADTASLQQVFLNLIVNARDALDSIPEGEKVLRISVKEENGHVVYRFVDSGPGLTPDVADKVFDPFFTTHGIVEKHGGSIQCKPKSALGGAEFVVRIPRPDEGEPGWDLAAREPGRMEDDSMRDAARRSQDLRRARAGEPRAAGRRE